MTLPINETASVPELPEAGNVVGTDLLLVTRPGSSLKVTASLLLAYILEHIDLSAFAPLASPALTGMPTAPTALPDTNTEQVANTAFVQAVKTALLGAISALTAASVGADPAGAALSAVNAHKDEVDAHGARSYAATVANDAEVAAKAYADLILTSAVSLRGGYDASSNAWPTTGGTGTAGAIKAGNLWFVSVPGTLGGKAVVVGDSFFAVTNNPGQVNTNWCVLDTNLGFVPEEAGTAMSAITAHLLAADPHGDRAYALALLNAHITANDPHGSLAAALAALATHVAASDAHGDRSYTDTAISTALKARINTQNSSYALQATDGDGRTYVRQTSSGSTNLTVPDDTTSIAVGIMTTYANAGSGTSTIVPAGGVTLNYVSGALTVGPGERRGLVKVAANTWDVL